MADKAEKITESAVSKAMKPSFETLGRIEKGITKLNAQGNEGAEERVEGARAKKKEAEESAKTNTLLAGIYKGIVDLNKTMLASVKAKLKSGFGNLLAGVIAPVLIMVGFFAQLKKEFKVLKTLTGGGLKKLFMPLKNLLMGEGKIAKGIKSALKFIDKMHGGIFTKIGNFFKNFGQNKMVVKVTETITKVKGSISNGLLKIKNFFQPVSDFFKSFQKVKPFGPPKPGLLTKGIQLIKNIIKVIGNIFKPIINVAKSIFGFVKTGTAIGKWAMGFGKLLGKLFLPITILMSAFDFVTGFLDGFKEDGIMGGLEGGLSKLLKGLIGMPLDLLKDGVSWILEKFGFEQASESLDSFSFSTLIDDMVGGFFDAVDGIIGWLGDKFSFSTIGEALTSMLNLIWMPAVLFKEWLIDPLVNWVGDMMGWDVSAITEFDLMKTIGDTVDDIANWFGKIFDIDIGKWIISMASGIPGGEWVLEKLGVGGGSDDDDKPKKSIKEQKKEALKKEIAEMKEDVGKDSWHETEGERKKDREELAAKQAELEKMEVDDKMAFVEKRLKTIDRMNKSNPNRQGRIDKLNAQIDASSQKEAIEGQLSKKQNKTLGRTAPKKSAVKVSSKKVALKGIDWKFISDKEGGSKTDGYVPNPEGSKSGVTIATGFDLGARSIKDLEGLPASLKSKLAPFMGLQGVVAAEALKNRGGLVITQQEAGLIDKMSKGQALKKLKREWNKNAAIMKGKTFDELSGAQKTVAASVAFQYGSLSKAPKFRNAAQSGDWDGAIGELRNFGDDYGSRRQSEADFLVANSPNRSGQTISDLSAENQYAKANMGQGGTNVLAPNNSKTYNTTSQPVIMAESARNINAKNLHNT